MRPSLISILLCAATVALVGCHAKYTGAVLTEDDLDGAEPVASRGGRGVVSLTGDRVIPRPVPITIADDPTLIVGPEPGEQRSIPSAQAPTPEAGATVIDAKVGDVNGRALYASEILDDVLGDRLRQTALQEGMTFQRWHKESGDLIAGRIQDIVNEELIEAEARAGMEPRMKENLRNWLNEQREEARRRQGGARSALEQSLREQGSTVQQWEQERERGVLIAMEIEEQVDKRSIVTWQDIRRYYELNHKQFNPDPVARFRIIRVFSSEADSVKRVQEALDAGQGFAAVAGWEDNTQSRERGGLEEKAITGVFAEGEYFGVPELNAAARTLRPDEWTRTPVSYGAFTAWLRLDSIETVRKPLSDPDVQLTILKVLTEHKRRQTLDRYIQRLIDRAKVTEFDEMTKRLLRIATERYWQRR